jgi:exopolyphosphatase/guanosine-5'-triphosphate,3'-diphosphate pyrophosphatase
VQRRQPGSESNVVVKDDQMFSVMKVAFKTELAERAAALDLDLSCAEYFSIALLCLKEILVGVGSSEFMVSPYSLREGLVYEFIEKNKLEVNRGGNHTGGPGYQAVLNLASGCGYPEAHSNQVARMADQIFPQIKDLHGLGGYEARLLELASILHDIE